MSFFPAGGLQELPFVIGDASWPGGAVGRSLVGSIAFGYMVGAGRTCQSVTPKSLPTPSSDYGKLLILPFFDVSDSDTSFFVLFFLQSTGHRHYIVHRALARNAPKTCYHYKKIAPSNNGEDYFRTGSRRSLSTLALHYIKIPLCLSSCRLVPSYV